MHSRLDTSDQHVDPAQESQGCPAAELAAINVAERIPAPAPRELPPYNGFGSLEDSAQSCRSLIPQVHRGYRICCGVLYNLLAASVISVHMRSGRPRCAHCGQRNLHSMFTARDRRNMHG